MLFVVDGGKAIRKALRDVFGDRAVGRFVHLWFVVHAETFTKSIDGAAATAADLYRRFATRLADDFMRGHRFVHDLPKVADQRSSRPP
jgi:hypothetical protein